MEHVKSRSVMIMAVVRKFDRMATVVG